eukprot:352495-Chlamydomonas_euryale.AAC.1
MLFWRIGLPCIDAHLVPPFPLTDPPTPRPCVPPLPRSCHSLMRPVPRHVLTVPCIPPPPDCIMCTAAPCPQASRKALPPSALKRLPFASWRTQRRQSVFCASADDVPQLPHPPCDETRAAFERGGVLLGALRLPLHAASVDGAAASDLSDFAAAVAAGELPHGLLRVLTFAGAVGGVDCTVGPLAAGDGRPVHPSLACADRVWHLVACIPASQAAALSSAVISRILSVSWRGRERGRGLWKGGGGGPGNV